jgi:serum/glucocorticoid-regulated kinase 2
MLAFQADHTFNQSSAVDTSNFDTEFTSLQAEDSVVEDSHLAQSIQDRFKGFTFAPSNMMSP